ncbi:MAG: hypothetical protein LBR71_02650 [Synergistaceae bacterium]|jgi:hypothetical protein|nr:hypothetical protein [Synergistaceae bacterium]
MLQPVNLQLAHFNVEHSAQISKDALAAVQQTAQGQENVQESVKRAQIVQAGLAAAETQKVKRREEDERERRGEKRQPAFSSLLKSEDEGESEAALPEKKEKSTKKGFELYA